MLENKDYCNHDICVALEELGFPIRRIKVKGEEKNVPILLYEAQKWLREENGIEIVVLSKGMIGSPYYYQVYTEDYVVDDNEEYSSYEEALSEGLRTSIKILRDE